MDIDKHFLSDLIDALPVALFCKDYTSGIGEFVFWNHQAEVTWGLKKEEVIGKSDDDFFPVDQAEHFKKKDLETIESGELIFIPEEPVDSPNLGTIMVRTWKVPLNDKEGRRYMLGMSVDISEQKKLEEELEREKQNAINSSKMAALGEMAGGIAHEINNPLSILTLSCDLLRNQNESDALDQASLGATIDRMSKTTDRISKVIRGLLNISRASTLEDVSETSVRDILDDVLGLCSEKFKARGVELIKKGDIGLYDMVISCNRVEISQVILNLLMNSFDAIKNLDEQWVEMELEQENESLLIRLTDSGNGIPEDLREKIFQPFYTSKDVGEGTGIGLSISKEIMAKHGGALMLNTEHPNTQFVVKISSEMPA